MKKRTLVLVALLCAGARIGSAQVVDVHGSYVQNVAPNAVPWGGGQTPYHMITIVDNGPALAMAVKRRSAAPNVIDNGDGTWNVMAGHDPTNVNPNFSLWNVSFYIGARNQSNFLYQFFYDFNPAPNTTLSELGRLSVTPACSPTCFANLTELNMGLANLSSLGGNTWDLPDTFFDVNAIGEYTFGIAASRDLGGGDAEIVDYVAIKVNTVSSVPEPGTYALVAAGLLLTGIASRSRRRKVS